MLDMIVKEKFDIRKQQRKSSLELTNMRHIAADTMMLFQLFSEIPEQFRGPIEGRTTGAAASFMKSDPKLVAYQDLRGLIMANIARHLGGEKGVLTDRDVKRIEDSLPKRSDTDESAFEKIFGVLQFVDTRVRSKQFESAQEPTGLGVDLREMSQAYAEGYAEDKQVTGGSSRMQPRSSATDYLNQLGF